jgi:hypothetical protein
MRTEQEIKDKINELLRKKDDLPGYDHTLIDNYTLQIIVLQWALKINENW